MIASLCLLSRDYLAGEHHGVVEATTAALASGFAAHGIAVHVIAKDQFGQPVLTHHDGVTVHRIADEDADRSPDRSWTSWAHRAASAYAELDSRIGFDVVMAPDRIGQALALEVSSRTVVAIQLVGSLALSARRTALSPIDSVARAVELESMRRADVLVAPTPALYQLALERTDTAVALLPPPVEVATGRSRTAVSPSSLVYVGELTEEAGVLFAIDTLARLRHRVPDAHLTVIGREVDHHSARARRALVLEHLRRCGLDLSAVRLVGRVEEDRIEEHLWEAGALVAGRTEPMLDLDAVRSLAAGARVVVGGDDLAANWIAHDPSVLVVAPRGRPGMAHEGAELLARLSRGPSAAAAARVRGLFSPERATERYLELFDHVGRPVRLDRSLRRDEAATPSLGVVTVADGPLAATNRLVESALEHTGVPLTMVVVDRDRGLATRALVQSTNDPRVVAVDGRACQSDAKAYNLGIAGLSGAGEYVAIVRPGTQLTKQWWKPLVDQLEANPNAAIASDCGATLVWGLEGRTIEVVLSAGSMAGCDVATGGCVMIRRSSLERIGGLDDRFGLALGLEDLALRAGRGGESVMVVDAPGILAEEEVHLVATRPPALGPLSDEHEALVVKHSRQQLSATTPYLMLCAATEALEDPSILSSYASAFTAADPSVLVLYGPGLDPIDYELRLTIAAQRAGFDLEHGPRLVALLPPSASAEEERIIADEVFSIISSARPSGGFEHLAVFPPGVPERLRMAAARMWAARPGTGADNGLLAIG